MSTSAKLCALALITCLAGCATTMTSTTTTTTLPAATCAIGAFINGMDNLDSFEAEIGRDLAVVLWYVHWQDPFPSSEADAVAANGSVPLITWEPWLSNPAGTLEAIATGSYESYVRSFFQACKDWGRPILLRFGHEMNGNWYPWDGEHNRRPGDLVIGERYINAWIYIYNVKRSVGADNVALVWCPNSYSIPDEEWNSPEAYYPGDDYVDWIGMDGYNWGYERWQSFDTVFSGIYAKITALTSKPLMIGEFAAAENNGDKAAWITDAFDRMAVAYPRIKLFCWFNINKERDWRVDSSTAAAAAFRKSLQSSYFSSKM